VLEALDVPEKIDLVDLNSVPNDLKEKILKEGKIWKDSISRFHCAACNNSLSPN
jgi:hypothetical protein